MKDTHIHGKIICIANNKGGIGKTSTAVNLTVGLQKLGYKTCLLDCDSQCNSSDNMRARMEDTYTLYDLLFGENVELEQCIQETEIGTIVPSDRLLREAETKFPNDNSRGFLLREKAEKLKDMYDFTIIDTAPALNILLINALNLADEIIVPITADRFSLQGLDVLAQAITATKKYTNPNIEIMGIVLTRYNERLKLSKEVSAGLPQVAEILGTQIFNTKIRESVAVRQSQSARKSLFDYDEMNNSTVDYLDLCSEVVKIEKEKGR